MPRRRLLRALATLHSVDAAREAGGVAVERLRGEMSASAPLDLVTFASILPDTLVIEDRCSARFSPSDSLVLTRGIVSRRRG